MSSIRSVNPTERRRFARVMDAIGLEFLHPSGEGDAADKGKAVVSPLADRYALVGYAAVKRDYPAVVEYIDVLEERIRQLELGGSVLVESPTHKVSLSASGIAFADERLLQPGDIVPLRLTLFPQLHRINCEAMVVSVGDVAELATDNQHSYRMVFVSLSAADVQLIDSHAQSLLKSVRQYLND